MARPAVLVDLAVVHDVPAAAAGQPASADRPVPLTGLEIGVTSSAVGRLLTDEFASLGVREGKHRRVPARGV
jgi:hypothetical protein